MKNNKKKPEFNENKFDEDLTKLQEGIKEAYNVMKELIPEAVLEKEVKDFGNASHIILPKEYAKKRAFVIIKK